MATEVKEQLRMPRQYSNGDILSPKDFTDLIVCLQNPQEVRLNTMSYGIPLEDGNALLVHRKLLELADRGTQVYIGIDNTYGNRIAPKTDIPIGLAKRFGQREVLEKMEAAYQDLIASQNTVLHFNGSENPPLFPISKVDHRKILLVTEQGSDQPSFGVIFGFNINYLLEPQVLDSAIYIDDPEALRWLKEYSQTPHYTTPVRKEVGTMTFTTRELTPNGNELADREILDVVQSAECEIIYCSQWLPDADVLDALSEKARSGVKITIFSNVPPFKNEPTYGFWRAKLLRKLAKLSRETGNVSLFVPRDESEFFHLKTLVVDGGTNHARAITGTDNMANRVLQNLGARELLITLNDTTLVDKLSTYLHERLVPESTTYDFNNLTWRRILLTE